MRPKVLIIIIFLSMLYSQEWNYSADILEKTIENNREVRLFKSDPINNNQVIIYNDSISIFTNQAKQYIDTNELHLIGPVTMLNGADSLTCEDMVFWYKLDSLQAFGNVQFNFKNNKLETDSLVYVETNGFRGYSFQAINRSVFYDNKYRIMADEIIYNDISQNMSLQGKANVKSNNQGALGENMNLVFNDSLIKNITIKNNGYVFNKHYAMIGQENYQLFQDEMKGNLIEVKFNNKNLDNILIKGMAQSIYYVVNDSSYLMGFNEATGDTISLKYIDENLNSIHVIGDARGIFYPEQGQTKIDSILEYNANKIDYNINDQITFLEDNVEIKYYDTQLTSNRVRVNWKSNTLYATSDDNQLAEILSSTQKPITGEKLEFDLINKKGIIRLGETTVGDGIYKSDIIFREEPNIYHMKKSIYTTCENDHPHYYFRTPRMKMFQGERIIAKPLLLYIYDIPIIGIPFAVLPNKSGGRQSGWIMPSFGVSNKMGTYFQKFGYYWAPNDYMDTRLLMDLYDEDRIEFRLNTRYTKRYQYNGNISSTLKRKLYQTNDMMDIFTDKSIQNFDIKWNHNQKIDHTQNFNVHWIYVTSSNFYNDTGYDLNTRTQQKLESSAGYSKIWPSYNNRFSLSLAETHDLIKDASLPNIEDNQDGPLINYYKNRVLPSMRFSHSSSKLFGNGDKWYNSIYYNFSSRLSGNQKIGHVIYINENTCLNSNWDSDTTSYDNHISHNMSFSAPNKIFGWLNINPSLNLTEGWIFKYYYNDEEYQKFKRRLTGNFSLSSSTTIYGLFPINLFNIEALRHTMSPTISLSYTPDFSEKILGIDLGYFSESGYDYFENSMIGSTPSNETRRISFNIRNNFQMKLNDSLKTKVDFLDWSINSGYNFMAYENKMDIIKSRLNLSLPNKFDFDFTMYHDPYILDENGNRTNQYANFPILTYLQGSTDLSLIGKKRIFIDDAEINDTLDIDQKSDLYNSNKFFEPEIDGDTLWELDLRIGAKLQKSIDQDIQWDKTLWIQPILKLQLTEKWKLTYAGQFDMISNEIVSHNMYLYRSLHCWEFGLKWWPSGSNSGFLLNIRVKSPDLRDIKLRSSGGSLFGI